MIITEAAGATPAAGGAVQGAADREPPAVGCLVGDHMRARYVGLFALSAAALLYELALTRIFAVAQGYHFAFLSLSLALLGFGASGAWLAMRAVRQRAEPRLDRLALATALAIAGSYLVLNRFPFDPYTIAWDPRQLLLLAVDYLALVVPFLLAGAAAGLCLSTWPELTPELYAANLAGSAAGSLAVLATLAAVGGSGTVFVAAALACLGALAFSLADGRGRSPLARCYPLPVLVALLGVAVGRPELVDVRLSPYKPLSYALHYPGSRIVYQRWNAYSRIDVVDSPGIRSAPGLSLRYAGLPPEQMGLTIDGGNLSPLTRSPTPSEEGFLSALQGALPHRLRPSGTVCLLDPRGGLDLLLALRLGAGTVDVVAPNPTVAQTVRDLYGGYTGHIYEDPRVRLHPGATRSFLARPHGPYDLLVFSLPHAYRPLAAGSYALGEDYLYTQEAFEAALHRLAPGGMLVAQAWLQSPPVETVRLTSLAAQALARVGVADPRHHVVAFRDWALMTILVQREAFSGSDLARIREFCTEQGFDLVAAPDLGAEEGNRYHVLATPAHDEACRQVLDPAAAPGLLARYSHDIAPTADERPFFEHTFRWRQLPEAWRSLGRSAQPFGGGGYLVLLALLGLAAVVSLALVTCARRSAGAHVLRLPALAYFALIGAGYITVELVLMQRSILLLDQPTYAFAAVLCTLLLASGLGSKLSPHLPLAAVLALLVAALGGLAWGWPALSRPLLEHSIGVRLVAVCGVVVPLGVLMGAPFPRGLARAASKGAGAVAVAWAANGCASVVGSIVATLSTLSLGYGWVLAGGALCYLLALAAERRWLQ